MSAFFGINRSTDETRLQGVNYDTPQISIEEALIEGVRMIEATGDSPTVRFCSPREYADRVAVSEGRMTATDFVNKWGTF